jgi:hypothetical protein
MLEFIRKAYAWMLDLAKMEIHTPKLVPIRVRSRDGRRRR